MFLKRANRIHPEFRIGAAEMWPQAPGMAAWGLMTGVAMANSGMGLGAALLMTLTVFAGSSQLAATPLMIAGAPAWVILATAFCVNLRFVVFSLHLRPYLMHLPWLERISHGYLTTDLTYVMFTKRFPHPGDTPEARNAQEAYLAGSNTATWISWMPISITGVVLANFIPTTWGLGFAGILCLIGILCSLASTRLRLLSAAVAAVAAIVAYQLPFKLNIVVAIAVAVLACMGTEKLRPAPGKERAE
ncbi:putative branched-subunit amino acid permease [Rhodoferax ferrireducens]|uniref:Branched-subunit amino acid permease n=1 Tax=Rhodoferax ferrireducens TaxID=192843 RepID=A0ABU2CB55_9BURK|nr:AzlC family ABC transporter permease [Rhodoferax ferrireducens]MDR7378575.1 putative branched-subunit amino acid permease [Rhodoferax ferrireducens]